MGGAREITSSSASTLFSVDRPPHLMITRSDASTARRAASSRRTLPWSGRVGARWMMTTRSVISTPLPRRCLPRPRRHRVSARSPRRSRRRRHPTLSPCRDPRGWGRRRRVRRVRDGRDPSLAGERRRRRRRRRIRRLRGSARPPYPPPRMTTSATSGTRLPRPRPLHHPRRSPPLPTTSSHFEVPPSPPPRRPL